MSGPGAGGRVVVGATWLRRLPPRVVRVAVALDVTLALVHPAWAWLLMWRWTGRALGLRSFLRFCLQSTRFIWLHLLHAGNGTGGWSVDWRSPPVRRATRAERPDWLAPGGCGTCKNCCTTSWLPPRQAASCPFLGQAGCTVYGGVFWDYFNCGRYPDKPQVIAAYGCARFDPNDPAGRDGAARRRLSSGPRRGRVLELAQPVG